MTPSSWTAHSPKNRLASTAGHAAQGALIGLVELVPGVSGGTVALVLGIYDRLVVSAHNLIRGAVLTLTQMVRRRGRSAATSRSAGSSAGVEWPLILPLAVGMFLALFALSGPLHSFVESEPVISRALFLGMVSASLLVPVSMIRASGPSRPHHRRVTPFSGPAVVLVVAVGVFLLLGLPTLAVEEPSGWVIVLSGAAAVCALALPGLSGSFVLLTFGMYEPTLAAVSAREGGYLALFVTGALLGLVSVVQLLTFLLRVHRRAVLLVATGLILGSLRALWPWQDGSTLLAPAAGDWVGPAITFPAGALVVLVLWWRDRPRDARPVSGGQA